MKTSKAVLLYSALTALVVACGGGGTPPPTGGGNTGSGTVAPPVSSLIVGDKISGSVTDTALFKGVVLMEADDPATSQAIAGDRIGSAGQIALTLSTRPPGTDFGSALPSAQSQCTFTGTASNSSAQIALYSALTGLSTQGDPVASIAEILVEGASVSGANVARVYSDSNLSLKGKVVCPDGPQLNYDLSLKAGWNAVELGITNTVISLSDLNVSARSSLKSTRTDAGVYVLLDSPSVINLKQGDRVQRTASLYQFGGYNGTVKLSTNVPGVSVEPSTLTLGNLGTQTVKKLQAGILGQLSRSAKLVGRNGVKAQRLDTTLTFVAAANAPGHVNTDADNIVVADPSGRQVGYGDSKVDVIAPGVRASLNDTTTLRNLTRGESFAIKVAVFSENGFSGPVTLSLGNLPDGVTMTPQSVAVSAGGRTDADLQITASATAVLGQVTLNLITSEFNYQSDNYTRVNVAVTPPRVVLSGDNAGFFTAKKGIWIQGREAYDPQLFQHIQTLRRLDGTAVINGLTLGSDFSFLSGLSGDLIGFRVEHDNLSGLNTGTVRTIHDDGSFRDVATGEAIQGAKGYYGSAEAAVDQKGNLWFNGVTTGSGFRRLSKMSSDGKITVVDQVKNYNAPSSAFVTSNDRRILVIRSSYYDNSSESTFVDTLTGEVIQKESILGKIWSFAVANDGTIWGAAAPSNVLEAIDNNGKVTLYNKISVSEIIGMDKTDQNILWIRFGNSVSHIYLPNFTVSTVTFATNAEPTIVLLAAGGVAVVYKDDAFNPTGTYLSFLK